MTQPTDPTLYGPTVPDDEALAFETAAVLAVTGTVVATVSAVLAQSLAAYTAGVVGEALGTALAAKLRWLRLPAMSPALRRVQRDGHALGVNRALRDLDRDLPVPLSGGERAPLPDPDRAVADALVSAAQLAASLPMRTKRDLLAVQGRCAQGLSTARGHARWTANESVNAGTADVARGAGLRLVWVAERNACLDCLAHAGYAVEPGDAFPIVSYDPIRPGRFGAVRWPPLHPNCRCQVRVYGGPAGAPPSDRSAIDPAGRLAAEARRSVVYQWTDHASGVRMRAAAARLLDVGAMLPASVEKRAAAALRRGRRVNRPT